jgi:hypothetical protein
MLDSDKVTLVADMKVHSVAADEGIKITKLLVEEISKITTALLRLEKPFTFGIYCFSLSFVFWSSSQLLHSIQSLFRSNKEDKK